MSQDKTKEEINYSEILVMLAKHYKDTKERYFDRHMKTCSMSNPNRRELTVFEQAEWQSFPLVQGTKLQNIVEKIATEPDFALPLQHQLTQAKGEIERLKEDNEQYAEEHEKSCNVTHNLHLLANDKRAEVIKLQSLLTQKDKEIAELKESENDFVLACNDYSDEVKELKKEIEALRAKWISVAMNPPKNEGYYNVAYTSDSKHTAPAYWNGEEFLHIKSSNPFLTVTHWMPLPPNPSNEKGEPAT